MTDLLDWDANYAVARALRRAYPDEDLEAASLEDIFNWTLALPEFDDDPKLANEEVLTAIYRDWLEEILEENS
jgi:FeS assembly protein IscX